MIAEQFVQIPLGLSLRDDHTFSNFIVGRNLEAVEMLRNGFDCPGDRFVYCWGSSGVGRSHLLQACCHEAENWSQTAFYLPLKDADQFSPEICEGLETLDLIAIDDLDAIANNPAWEEALFHLYNRVRDGSSRLLMTGSSAPAILPIALSDLRSRVAWGMVYQINELSDHDKCRVLQLRAERRGLELSESAAVFLCRRMARDLGALLQTLDRLDQASLSAQRKLTIPFLKEALDL
jgi:DnaA family protein